MPQFTDIKGLVGQEFLVSGPTLLTQQRIDDFAAASGDDQWLHTDPERAQRESPYGTTIAHGFLTLSLLPSFTVPFFRRYGVGHAINYGCEKVRFPAPATVNCTLVAHFTMLGATPAGPGLKLLVAATMNADNQSKPVCYAENVLIVFPA